MDGNGREGARFMITSTTVRTARLETHVREVGSGTPVALVHGNTSDGRVWREQLDALPKGWRGVAVDLRGYGRSERKPLDATRGTPGLRRRPARRRR